MGALATNPHHPSRIPLQTNIGKAGNAWVGVLDGRFLVRRVIGRVAVVACRIGAAPAMALVRGVARATCHAVTTCLALCTHA